MCGAKYFHAGSFDKNNKRIFGEKIIMEVTAILTVLGVFISNAAMVIPLFLWVRAEARADARHTDAKLESTRELVRAIHDEMKDFHTKLAKQDEEFKAHLTQLHK
jgi:hypothetical protein